MGGSSRINLQKHVQPFEQAHFGATCGGESGAKVKMSRCFMVNTAAMQHSLLSIVDRPISLFLLQFLLLKSHSTNMLLPLPPQPFSGQSHYQFKPIFHKWKSKVQYGYLKFDITHRWHLTLVE